MRLERWTNVGPIRDLRDIEALEAIPLADRFDTFDINAWVRRGCGIDPARTAIAFFRDGDPRVTPVEVSYGDLLARITRTANLLHDLGVRATDPVLFLLPNIPDAHVVLLASMARGIACPVNWMLASSSIAELVARSRARVIVALGPTPGFKIWETLQDLRPSLSPDVAILSLQGPGGTRDEASDLWLRAAHLPDDRLVFDAPRARGDVVAYVHSGGTTGTPKLVQLTSGAMVHKCWAVTVTMGHQTSDVIFADMPLFHVAGFISCVVLPTVLGSQVVIPTVLGARDKTFLKNYWHFVERMRITFMHAVPATLSILAQNGPTTEDVSSLRDYSTTGSTSLPVEVARTIERKLGIRIVATYGATEFTQNVTQVPRNGDPRYGSTGIRLPDVEIRIVHLDAQGAVVRDCNVDEIGCVLVKSPGTTPGYLDASQNAGVLLGGGWINNGDLGRLDADGYLWITGRAKDLIIRGGHNIDPATIEEALYAHGSVFLGAAVGKPDAYAGELPVAFVQMKDGATTSAAELVDFARTRISDPVAVPKDIFIIDEMPLTDVRKVDKVALRRMATERTLVALLQARLPAGAQVHVTARADERQGTRVRISVGNVPDEAAASAAVGAAMNGFALAWDLELAPSPQRG